MSAVVVLSPHAYRGIHDKEDIQVLESYIGAYLSALGSESYDKGKKRYAYDL